MVAVTIECTMHIKTLHSLLFTRYAFRKLYFVYESNMLILVSSSYYCRIMSVEELKSRIAELENLLEKNNVVQRLVQSTQIES